MPESAADLAFAVDLFSDINGVRARRMFRGAGPGGGAVMFGAVAEAITASKPPRRRRA